MIPKMATIQRMLTPGESPASSAEYPAKILIFNAGGCKDSKLQAYWWPGHLPGMDVALQNTKHRPNSAFEKIPKSLLPLFAKTSPVAVFLFNLAHAGSLEKLKKRHKEYLACTRPRGAQIFIVGNLICGSERKISLNTAKEALADTNATYFEIATELHEELIRNVLIMSLI